MQLDTGSYPHLKKYIKTNEYHVNGFAFYFFLNHKFDGSKQYRKDCFKLYRRADDMKEIRDICTFLENIYGECNDLILEYIDEDLDKVEALTFYGKVRKQCKEILETIKLVYDLEW